MKKLALLFALAAGTVSQSQTINGDYLDINNIKARFNSEGSLFSDFGSTFNNAFEAPQGSGAHTLFAGGLWIGGMDVGGTLKVAAQTYRQIGTDFWPGPLTPAATTDSATMAFYNRVWKVNKCDIDDYSSWIAGGMIGPNPIDSAGNEAINSWPAVTLDGQILAPFVDINSNGIYEPLLGDVPNIKGDQAIFFVYNDKGGIHTESGGASIGIEIHGMAYAYSCIDKPFLYNTVFTHYKIINKSSFRLDSAFIGNWTDLDIGNWADDYVECDVSRGAFYAYNGDSIDEPSSSGVVNYGANPPAQAIVFLAGPFADGNGADDPAASTPNGLNYGNGITDDERLGMTRFLYYHNNFTVTGHPLSASAYYGYLTGAWQDGTPWTYGGTGHLTGAPCNYIFPGASDPLGYGTTMTPQPQWDEMTEGNVPSDRRGIGSTGPFSLQPAAANQFDFAYVFGRATSGGNMASVALMKNYIDSLRLHFADPNLNCSCTGTTGISINNKEETFALYPNPSSDILNIETSSSFQDFTLQIFDATGKLVMKKEKCFGFQTLYIHGLKPGIYLLNLQSANSSLTRRFLRE